MSRRGTNIRKRADGRWEGRYYIVDTAGSKKCKSVYGHSYKEVTERLLTAKAASLNQTAAPKQSAITVKEVAEKWFESIAYSRKCSTIQKYSTIYNKYIKPNWGESVIDQLNQNEILKLLPETAGESVIKSILCIFNSILAYGAATYGTGEIHLSYRSKRSSVTSSNNINTINTTDQQKLTEYLLTELDIYKLGILLCLFMGLRLGEICALKWEDIDMISRTLHVNRTVQRLPVDAFQDINDIPGELPEGRTKPWGTGQAVLAAKNVIDTPFIVINADDYYGKEGFKAVHEYLVNGGKSCMAGFVLKNTLSDNGGVTRGICKMDENGNLTEVVETKNIVKTADGAKADGVVVDVNSLVSMNMWGLTPDFLDVLENGFKEFFQKEVPGNPQKAEYLIPIFIGELLEQGKMSVKVLKTDDTWYGMTYHEDVAAVRDSFKKMLADGVYKADLFADL